MFCKCGRLGDQSEVNLSYWKTQFPSESKKIKLCLVFTLHLKITFLWKLVIYNNRKSGPGCQRVIFFSINVPSITWYITWD